MALDLCDININFQSRSNQRLLSLWEKCLATFCPIWGFSLHDQKIQRTKLNWNVFFTWHSLRGRKKTVSFSERKRNDSEISTSDTTTDNNGRSLDTEVSCSVTWTQISEKVIYIKGRFSRSRTLSATTRRRRRGAVCRVRGGAGRLALARWTMGTVLLVFSFFEGKADDDKYFILCWEQASLWDSKSPNMSKMGFEENVVFSVEVGMHSDRARDYQTLHSDYFLRLNSI